MHTRMHACTHACMFNSNLHVPKHKNNWVCSVLRACIVGLCWCPPPGLLIQAFMHYPLENIYEISNVVLRNKCCHASWCRDIAWLHKLLTGADELVLTHFTGRTITGVDAGLGARGAREGVGKRWEGVWKEFGGITTSRAK